MKAFPRSIAVAFGIALVCSHAALATDARLRLSTDPKASRLDRQFGSLVVARAAAIGALLAGTTDEVRIRFVGEDDASLADGKPGRYD